LTLQNYNQTYTRNVQAKQTNMQQDIQSIGHKTKVSLTKQIRESTILFPSAISRITPGLVRVRFHEPCKPNHNGSGLRTPVIVDYPSQKLSNNNPPHKFVERTNERENICEEVIAIYKVKSRALF